MLEIRNPKHEIRNKSEIRVFKSQNTTRQSGSVSYIGISNFGICFEFPISTLEFGFGHALSSAFGHPRKFSIDR